MTVAIIRRSIIGLVVWFGAFLTVLRAQFQGRWPSLVRLEAGSLNPGDPFQARLALGGTLGWQLNPHAALLLRYLRQSQSGSGFGMGDREFLMANWERAFGETKKYRRQALVRLGVGALFRSPLLTAPVLSGGVELRYGLATHWSLVAAIEDHAAALEHQDLRVCTQWMHRLRLSRCIAAQLRTHDRWRVAALGRRRVWGDRPRTLEQHRVVRHLTVDDLAPQLDAGRDRVGKSSFLSGS